MNRGEISKTAVAELIGMNLSEVKNDMVAPNRKAERISCRPMCLVRSNLVRNGARTTKAITVCEVLMCDLGDAYISGEGIFIQRYLKDKPVIACLSVNEIY